MFYAIFIIIFDLQILNCKKTVGYALFVYPFLLGWVLKDKVFDNFLKFIVLLCPFVVC